MKIIITIVLSLLIVVLGCTPTPKTEVSPVPASEIDIDELLANYQGGDWITNYDSALKFAAELNRPILINFTGSDWCGWCIRLHNEVFSKAEFNDYAKDNLILLKLDFPRNIAQSAEIKSQNQRLQSKFSVRGYPTIVLINAKETELARLGYQQGGAQNYVNHLKELLKK